MPGHRVRPLHENQKRVEMTNKDLFPDILYGQLDSYSIDTLDHDQMDHDENRTMDDILNLSEPPHTQSSPENKHGTGCPTFSDGSESGAVINLCSATLGAGVLSIPFAFSKAGLVLGTTLLLLAALATVLSIKMLVRSCHKTRLNSYEELTASLFGVGMAWVVETCILIFCFGVCVAYIVAVGDILQIGILNVFADRLPDFFTREFLMVMFWSLVMFPLSLLERINSLRFASLFGILSICFLVLSVVFHSLRNLIEYGYDQSWGSHNFQLWPASFFDVIRACPIIIFSFSCQVNVCAIYGELHRPSISKMTAVSSNAVILCIAAYLLMGCFAYLEFGDITQDNVLKNYCVVRDSPDPLMISAFACISFSIVMAFPLNVMPARVTLDIIFRRVREWGVDRWQKGEESEHQSELEEVLLDRPCEDGRDEGPASEAMSAGRRFFLTLLISGSALLVALVVPDISIVFGLMGGTASSIVCFIMPASFFIKLRLGNERRLEYFGAWLLIIVGVVIGVLSTGTTLYSLFSDEETANACPSDE